MDNNVLLKSTVIPTVLFVLLFPSLSYSDPDFTNSWEQIVLSGEIEFEDENGIERTLHPSCSGGPICGVDPVTGQLNCRLGDTEFSFFLHRGKFKKLMVFFDGGGACWHGNNCISVPTYNPEVNETVAAMAQAGGVFDFTNPDNPFKDWSVAFVPYCTGDIHWGSKDTAYVDPFGFGGVPGADVTIHHRGFDNAMAVLNWFEGNYSKRHEKEEKKRKKNKKKSLKKVKQLMVTGSSAGAYGALFAFPYWREALPKANTYLVADAGNGIVSDEYIDAALLTSPDVDTSAWGAQQNLATWIPGMETVFLSGEDLFAANYVTLLSNYYADTKIGQYTTAWDATQTSFLHVMQNITDPTVWLSPTPQVFCEWHGRMLATTYAQSAAANYRYYIGAGLAHTIWARSGDPAAFYQEASAGGVRYRDWIAAMLDEDDEEEEEHDKGRTWENLECTDCAPPFDPSLCGF